MGTKSAEGAQYGDKEHRGSTIWRHKGTSSFAHWNGRSVYGCWTAQAWNLRNQPEHDEHRRVMSCTLLEACSRQCSQVHSQGHSMEQACANLHRAHRDRANRGAYDTLVQGL